MRTPGAGRFTDYSGDTGMTAENRATSPKGPPTLVERLAKPLKDEERPFALVVQIYVLEGSETRFETVAARTAKLTQAEKGCLAYDFYRDLEKPCHYTLVERWEGLEPLRKHLASEHIREFQVLLAEIGTTPRTADLYALVDGKSS
jgi:quinol monooxygenase YgiN